MSDLRKVLPFLRLPPVEPCSVDEWRAGGDLACEYCNHQKRIAEGEGVTALVCVSADRPRLFTLRGPIATYSTWPGWEAAELRAGRWPGHLECEAWDE